MNFKWLKYLMMALAAAVYVPLVADWCEPGSGLHLAASWLGLNGAALHRFPLWGVCVWLVGKDIALLGCISMAAALFIVAMIVPILGGLFEIAVRKAKAKGAKRTPAPVKPLVVVLTTAVFILTPGLLLSATRISPLMVSLLPPMVAVLMLVREFSGEERPWFDHLTKGGALIFTLLVLFGYFIGEVMLAKRMFLEMAVPALLVFLALGVLPALVAIWLVHLQRMSSPRVRWIYLGAWALAVVILGGYTFSSDVLDRGRVANRLVSRILVNAEGKAAVAGDGVLDDMFLFMLPEDVRLITLARERDADYGRELVRWVEGIGSTNRADDLVFAAELGPRALIDEWARIDIEEMRSSILTLPLYFPTHEDWNRACDELKGFRAKDPSEPYVRRLLGVCGNRLGCKMLESGDQMGAWEVFWRIVGQVDRKNRTALLNLMGMVERGYKAKVSEVENLNRRRQDFEKKPRGRKEILAEVSAGGELYIDPTVRQRYEKMLREHAAETVKLTPETENLIGLVASAPRNRRAGEAARDAIRKAVEDGVVRLASIGGALLSIDMALGDVERAESDAIEVLRADRHDPTANAVLGSLCSARGEYVQASRYFARAVRTGRASVAAKNNYAVTLLKLGRADEAEPLAREAVKDIDGVWQTHETLLSVLIGQGKIDEAERELAQTERLMREAGIPEGKIVDVEIDRIRLAKARGEMQKLKLGLRTLRARTDLTAEQRETLKGMDW